MSEPTLKALQGAVEGLLYPSEQDHPLRAVYWPRAEIGDAALDADLVRKQAKVDADVKAHGQSASAFFKPVTTAQSWHSAEEQAAVERFRALEGLLQSLAGLTVIVLGGTDRQVYVLGETATGDVAGITTKVVAT